MSVVRLYLNRMAVENNHLHWLDALEAIHLLEDYWYQHEE